MPLVEELAPAKINLFLHVLGRRADGYHDLETLFAFVDFGDRLTVETAAGWQLTLDGPFAAPLVAEDDNLVMRAGRAFMACIAKPFAAHVRLHKAIPVAAGLGGGSADAAAMLRALNRLAPEPLPLTALTRIAADLGADVPACIECRPRIGHGTGTRLDTPLSLPPARVLLANPRVPLATAAVFRRLRAETLPPAPQPDGDGWTLAALAARGRNDLEPEALALAPAIKSGYATLRNLPGLQLARLSGSGPTLFALFPSDAPVEALAGEVRRSHPDWWLQPCSLFEGDSGLVND